MIDKCNQVAALRVTKMLTILTILFYLLVLCDLVVNRLRDWLLRFRRG